MGSRSNYIQSNKICLQSRTRRATETKTLNLLGSRRRGKVKPRAFTLTLSKRWCPMTIQLNTSNRLLLAINVSKRGYSTAQASCLSIRVMPNIIQMIIMYLILQLPMTRNSKHKLTKLRGGVWTECKVCWRRVRKWATKQPFSRNKLPVMQEL